MKEILKTIIGKNYTYDYNKSYKELICVLETMTPEEKKEIKFEELYEEFLWNVSENYISIEVIYEFCKKINPELKDLAEESIKENGETINLVDYIIKNNPEGKELIELSTKAIGRVMVENATDLEKVLELKKHIQEKENTHDKVIENIKNSKNKELIVCAALTFEPKLIEEIYGGKTEMYLYLCINTFTDEQNIEFYKERLLTMDDNELNNIFQEKVDKIENKIKMKNF